MKFEDWKQWLPMLLFCIPALWLSLYVWAWLARVGCGEVAIGACLVTALGTWGSDLVMFRWMDTTFGAGMLAVAAAGTVLINSAVERRARLVDAAHDEHRRTVSAVSAVGLAFLHFSLNVRAWSTHEDLHAGLDKLDAATHPIDLAVPELAHSLHVRLGLMRIFADGLNISDATPETLAKYRRETEYLARSCALYMSRADVLFASGRYQPVRIPVVEDPAMDPARLAPLAGKIYIDEFIAVS